MCGESGGGGGGSGKVSLGKGRVKGPLPDGLLTLWCPARPIPGSTLGGREDAPGFSLHPNPRTLCLKPREVRGEKTSPAEFPGSGGKRGPGFKPTVTGVETEAPILGLRDPSHQDLVWQGGRKRLRGCSEGGEAGRHLPNPSPRQARARRQPVWPSGLHAPATSGGCGFTVVGHERAGDLRLVTGCSQSPYPCVTLGHFLGWALVSPSGKWSRQNLVPFWKS